MKKIYWLFSLLYIIGANAFAQNQQKQALSILQNRFYADFLNDQKNVKAYVKKSGMPLRWSDKNRSYEIQRLDEQGKPQILVTESNVEAANSTGASAAWSGGSLGLNLNGQGMIIGEWDDGAVLRTHQEFATNRVVQVDGATTTMQHATHVAGTLIGNGTNASAKGMMHQGILWAHDWTNDQAEMAAAANNGLRISNHSYGWLTGWAFTSGAWYWFGNTAVSTTQDNTFGQYNSRAQQWDQIAFNAPNYLIVKAAGNDRGEGPSPGTSHFVWNGSSWVSSTATRDRDGGSSGYDCLSHSAVSKNVLTVGAVNRLPSGYNGPSSVVMSSFSCWGPTDDGRIKPDIVGAGVGILSASTPNNNSYATLSGTSMASPNVAGSLGLIQQHAQNVRGSMLRGATLKGLAIHTAHEAGPNPGPDYMFGWGLLNVVGAINTISSVPSNAGIFENTLAQGNSFQINVYNDGTQPLEATICWYDPAGAVNASNSLNDRSARLVNDLDLRITRVSDGQITMPWVLNPDAPAAAATRGDNIKDNVEKVSILNPVAGWYTITVTHKGSLQGGSQAYSLIYTGASLSASCSEPTNGGTATGPSSMVEGNSSNFSVSGFNGTAVQWQSSSDGGNTWSDIPGANAANVAITLPVGTYLIRAAVSRINCTTSYSNTLSVLVNPLLGNTLANPIIVNAPYSGNFSTGPGSGFTSNYTGPNNQSSPDIFFRITTGPCIDSLVINTCTSNFDTYLHLLNASGGHITSLDDNGPLCSGTRASMKVAVLPNTTYFVVAEGYASATGNLSIQINTIDNPVFTPTITPLGPTSVCQGGTVTLSASSGNAYLWSTGATTQNITVSTAGDYFVTVTNAAGCVGTSLPVSVTILPNPQVFTLSGDGNYCSVSSGASISLSGSETGVTYEFLFAGGNVVTTLTGNGGPLQANNITGNGTLIARAITAAGCTLSMNGSVTVQPVPAETWYQDLDGDGYGNASVTLAACVQPIGYVSNANDCNDNDATIHPGAEEICGNGIDDNCNGQVDENCIAYTWYQDADADGFGNPNQTLITYTPIAPAGYTATAGDCNDADAAINPNAAEICNGIDDNCNGLIDENTPALAAPGIIDGPAGVCRNTSNIVFTVEPVSGATAYIWTLPPGASGSSNTNSISVSFNNSYVTGNICVSAANGCVQSAATCRQVAYISSRPGTPGTITGPTTVCPGSTHTYTIAPLANATSYVWTAPANASIISGQGTTQVVVQFASNYTTASLSVRGENCVGLSSSARTLSIARQGTPSTPSTITGNTSVCVGATLTYSVSPVSGVTYNWTAPANTTIISGQGTNSIQLAILNGFTSGTLTVNASNCVGTSSNRTLNISTSLPTPASITGPTTEACAGITHTYTSALVAGAQSYQWTVPAGAIITSGQGSSQIQVIFPTGFVSGTISVAAVSTCTTSTARSITVRGIPAQPGTISGPANNVCGGVYTYSIGAVAGATSYSWTVPTAWSIVQNNNTQIEVSVPANFTTGTISVRASNACGTSTARTLNVSGPPATPANIVGPTSVCAGQRDLEYATTGVAGLTYNWTLPSGASLVSGAGTPVITAHWGNSSGNIQVRAVNTCGNSGARQLSVSVVACRMAMEAAELHEIGVDVHPNPGYGVYSLNLSKPLDTDAEVLIYSVQGKLIAKEHIKAGQLSHVIDLQKVATGIYLLKIQHEQLRHEMKLIKQ